MNKKITVSVALAITIIAMTVTFAITWLLSMYTFDNTVSAVTRLQAQYAKLAEIDFYVQGNFYGEIDNNYLFDRVAVGYMNGLGDRYSTYYTEREYTEYQNIENGTLSGVGIEVLQDADGFRIVRVYADSPAAKAGVTKNGRIARVDGVEAAAIANVNEMQRALRGEEGSELVLDVVYGVADESQFVIQRSRYAAPTVESIYFGEYCYIRIHAFTAETYTDFDYELHQAQNQGVKGFVFDVRSTSGGQFRNCYECINVLAPRGTVAKSVNKTGAVRVLATSDDASVDLPMVVLTDAATAGPAELFAVSLRDMCGARIAGARTAGKSSIQSTPQRLADGSAVSVTTAMLLTGRDESLEGGIAPDVELGSEQLTPDMLYDPDPMADTQILRAIEMVRAMVREAGGDPGPAITTLPGGASGGGSGGNSAATSNSNSGSSSSPGEDSSLAGEGDSLPADDSGAAESAAEPDSDASASG